MASTGSGRQASGTTRRPTVRDVAAHAGVSPKTVSNVVHGYAHVADETRRRVEAALAELDYRPNLSARQLRGGRSGLIALVLPALDMPYFAEFARHVIREAAARSFSVIIEQTDGIAEREREILRRHHRLLIDGIIFSPLGLSSDELERRPEPLPLVLLGERIRGGSADHVGIDNVAAGREATRHLIECGRRRIAAIGTQVGEHRPMGQVRVRGYANALREAGRTLEPELMRPVARFQREDGAAAMRDLLALDEPPDAVFAFNDLLALGAMRAALESDLRVPEDVAIIGIDDIEEGRYSSPTLSTIAPDKARIAAVAVHLLDARIADGEHPAREVETSFALRARESTLGRPKDTSRGSWVPERDHTAAR